MRCLRTQIDKSRFNCKLKSGVRFLETDINTKPFIFNTVVSCPGNDSPSYDVVDSNVAELFQLKLILGKQPTSIAYILKPTIVKHSFFSHKYEFQPYCNYSLSRQDFEN